jgi:DNA-binding CsgD family transcriptional regulator
MYRLPDFSISLGYVSILEGDYELGAALNEEAARHHRERGYKSGLQFALDNLGWAALLRGDHERAKAAYEESLVVCKELGDKMVASESLGGLACVAVARGEAEQAARLFGAAEALREAVGYQHTPEEDALREPYLVASRSGLEETWEAAFAEGRTMTFEEAVEYALSEEEPSTATLSSSRPEHPAGLTSREIEVLGLVAAGMTSAQIAKELFLSPRTVETHITSIYHKLGVTSRAAATRFALKQGLA